MRKFDDAFQRVILDHLVAAGLAEMSADNSAIKMTDAGVDYVESVLQQNVTEPMKIYALGWLQGMKEMEKAK